VQERRQQEGPGAPDPRREAHRATERGERDDAVEPDERIARGEWREGDGEEGAEAPGMQ
jgi:hypothetical protein